MGIEAANLQRGGEGGQANFEAAEHGRSLEHGIVVGGERKNGVRNGCADKSDNAREAGGVRAECGDKARHMKRVIVGFEPWLEDEEDVRFEVGDEGGEFITFIGVERASIPSKYSDHGDEGEAEREAAVAAEACAALPRRAARVELAGGPAGCDEEAAEAAEAAEEVEAERTRMAVGA